MAEKDKATGSFPRVLASAEGTGAANGTRVLLVDDSATVHEFVRSALPGCTVERLANFVDLPAYLRGGEPAAIILDVEMPGISGQAFARFLRRCTPSNIPIILYSSVDDARLSTVSEEVGARIALRKTGDGRALRVAVESVLRAGAPGAGAAL